MRRSTPFLISGAVVLLAAACTHDFDAFESGSGEVGADGSTSADASSGDGASGGDAASGDSGSGGDSGTIKDAGVDTGPPCILPPDCADAAAGCGSSCNQTEFTCESACHNPGKAACQADCRDAGAQCTGGCVAACLTCSGCVNDSACKTAAQ